VRVGGEGDEPGLTRAALGPLRGPTNQWRASRIHQKRSSSRQMARATKAPMEILTCDRERVREGEGGHRVQDPQERDEVCTVFLDSPTAHHHETQRSSASSQPG